MKRLSILFYTLIFLSNQNYCSEVKSKHKPSHKPSFAIHYNKLLEDIKKYEIKVQILQKLIEQVHRKQIYYQYRPSHDFRVPQSTSFLEEQLVWNLNKIREIQKKLKFHAEYFFDPSSNKYHI